MKPVDSTPDLSYTQERESEASIEVLGNEMFYF